MFLIEQYLKENERMQKLPAIWKYTVLYTYVLKGCLHESRLSYNPDRTHSVFEIIGVGLDLLRELRLSYASHSGMSFSIISD